MSKVYAANGIAQADEFFVCGTEPAKGIEPAEAGIHEWEKILVQFEKNTLVDTRTGERYTDGYRSTVCTVSKFGNLSIHFGCTSHGKTVESCRRATNRMLRKALGLHISSVVAEGATLEAMHASVTDETVHERFKVWAAGLFE